jgi:hypothetical protein
MGAAVSITRLDLTASELRKAASGEKNSAATAGRSAGAQGSVWDNPTWRRISLRHAAGHEAADRGPERTLHWPNHRPARSVRLGDNSIIGDVDPLAIEPDTIMSVGGFPIDVG